MPRTGSMHYHFTPRETDLFTNGFVGLGYYGPMMNNPRQTLEQSLEDCFAKIISMHDDADDVLSLISTTKSSDQVSTSVD
jgi:hypothetical protein